MMKEDGTTHNIPPETPLAGSCVEFKSQAPTYVFSIPDTKKAYELEPDTVRYVHRLAQIMERMQLADYLAMMTRPGRVLYVNFIAGLSRGLGFGIGTTIMLALLFYGLGQMVDLPLIGEYVAKIVKIVQQEIGPQNKF